MNVYRPSRREFLLTTLAAPIAGAAILGAQTKKPMKIAFIGSGRQGGALGLQFAKAGHEVFFSSRNPDGLKDLVGKAGARARAGTPDAAATITDVSAITGTLLKQASVSTSRRCSESDTRSLGMSSHR